MSQSKRIGEARLEFCEMPNLNPPTTPGMLEIQVDEGCLDGVFPDSASLENLQNQRMSVGPTAGV